MRVVDVEGVAGAILDSSVNAFEAAHQEALERRPEPMRRPHVHGKFLFVGDEKFWIRGVTYGTFRPDAKGVQFPTHDIVADDFRTMAEVGLNSIRVYTPPPLWLMDTAAAFGLRVMVGLPWEQHIVFLDDRHRVERIMSDLRTNVQRLAAHPALLCYAVGNEIPASVVRWYGKSRVETFIGDLSAAAKSEDTGVLVTYVNFPTTEYLDLPLLDFVSFNVYLESQDRLGSYLARLQNLAGERPLVMTEIGLDSRRNGEDAQAQSLHWQIRTAFEAGCVGAFVFSWTDEWFRGGQEIADWDFGLVTRERRPKPALRTVSARFAETPFSTDLTWPRISVVVCSYNGARTIAESLAALENLDYPDYEVIVVDDGSIDETSRLAGKYAVRLIRTENSGLSAARNRGLQAATGEIVAYIDDDAYPDPHWLKYLAAPMMRNEQHAGIGGPNLAPPGDGVIADCIANSPGGPTHVLLSDQIAEHIPGCNMAFKRDRLLAIGGFDQQFRVAGDDVDVCWRLQDRGWTLGFAPAAIVWHHRRNSVKRYFQQQLGYAQAEALLAQKWPAKYNCAGHLTWQGRLYGKGVFERLFAKSRIYHGVWGSAPFQSVYERAPGLLWSFPLMPEWYFLIVVLWCCALLGFSWQPLIWVFPLATAALGVTVVQAVRAGNNATFLPEPHIKLERLALRLLVTWLHLLQPMARLLGRIQQGLGPWSWKGFVPIIPAPTSEGFWSECYEPTESRLAQIEQTLQSVGGAVVRGGDFDRWDLAVIGGLFGSIRCIAMVEEHGNGKQLFRLRAWPKVPVTAIGAIGFLSILAGYAMLDGAFVAAISLGGAAALLIFLAYADCAVAMKFWRNAINHYFRTTQGLVVLTAS
jgi:GT2 family glycosyltransferase